MLQPGRITPPMPCGTGASERRKMLCSWNLAGRNQSPTEVLDFECYGLTVPAAKLFRKGGGEMKKLMIVLLLLACVGCSESPEEYAKRDAEYQLAKKECAEIVAKVAIRPGGSFTREIADAASDAMVRCVRSRGFKVP